MKKWICILGSVLAMPCWGNRADLEDRILAGRNLSAEDVKALEQKINETPDDIDSRIKLVGSCWDQRFGNSESATLFRQQALWLIEHAPEHEIHSSPYCSLDRIIDGNAFSKGRDLWIKQVEAAPENVAILGNAAHYLLQADRKTAEEYLLRAQKLDPENIRWCERLAQIYSLNRKVDSGAANRALAVKELAQLEKAYEMASLLERDPLQADLAKAAFAAGEYEKARETAMRMVEHPGQGWNSGNNVHHGNMVLGLVALHEGDLEAAKKYLIESGKTKGSPQLDSFGPNMILAKALLEKGETDAVIEYFTLCGNFWEMDRGKLKQWSALAKQGIVPDFGANLRY